MKPAFPDDALAALAVFRGTPAAEVRALRRLGGTAHYEAGQVIYAQGEAMQPEALLLVRGRARVSVESGGVTRALAQVFPGEFVGEAGLFTVGPGRTATVIAEEPCAFLRITRELLASHASHPALIALERELIETMVRRIRAAQSTLEKVLAEQAAAENAPRPVEIPRVSPVALAGRVSLAQRLSRWFQGGA